MSIEDRIAELTAAVEKLTAAITAKAPEEPKQERKPRAKKEEAAPAAAKEEAPPVVAEEPKIEEPSPVVTTEEASAPITFEEVRREFLDLYKINVTAAQAVVTHFGVPKLTAELIAVKGAEVMAEIKKAKAA